MDKSYHVKSGARRLTGMFFSYRRLNSATIPNTFPLSQMDGFIELFGESAIFTTLDINNSYFQMPLDPAYSAKETFRSH